MYEQIQKIRLIFNIMFLILKSNSSIEDLGIIFDTELNLFKSFKNKVSRLHWVHSWFISRSYPSKTHVIVRLELECCLLIRLNNKLKQNNMLELDE